MDTLCNSDPQYQLSQIGETYQGKPQHYINSLSSAEFTNIIFDIL